MRREEKRRFGTDLQRASAVVFGVHSQSSDSLNRDGKNMLLASLLFVVSVLLSNPVSAISQQQLDPNQVVANPNVTPQAESTLKETSQMVRAVYILGPDDILTVQGNVDEFNTAKLIRVEGDGRVNLPLIGNVSVSGLTLRQAESEIASKLRTYVQDPQVIVQVTAFRSQPVSVLGFVNKPGIQEIQGPRTLVEIISLSGGLQPVAGANIKITRPVEMGKIPLASATLDPSGKLYIAEVNIKAIMNSKNLEENIYILPHDVISVPKAPIIYVMGSVKRSGGFVLGDKETITALEALTLAEGWIPLSAPNNSRIFRLPSSGTDRVQIEMKLTDIVKGKVKDIPLQPEDILYVPGSDSKKIWAKIGSTALSVASGMAIYSTRGY
jgi:polysaccharide biosynthesis/export protein